MPAQVGKALDRTAIVAPSLAAAAQYYPAIYWASMIRVPDKSRFPGTGDAGNGIPQNFKTQEQWLNFVKTNGCGNCHQIGNYATRNIPAALGEFDSSRDSWSQRLSVGPAGHDMLNFITQVMTPDGGHLAALADWTDRVKAASRQCAMAPRVQHSPMRLSSPRLIREWSRRGTARSTRTPPSWTRTVASTTPRRTGHRRM